ncbi:MAG: recombination protein RecR [Deltaproteobacteria bacterium]|nr:recombination protein RecR [Deltaproteobacteria bacterium]MCB9787286.1 recombination protein RecR [Deltaproteobacteria bacterium]
MPQALEKLVSLLARLPGIGERSATRLAFYMLSQPESYARELSGALVELVERVHFCVDCHMVAEGERCTICEDPSRERTTLCVVEGIADLLAFERSGAYHGLYHVLHGVLAPLKGVGPDELRLANLRGRIEALGTSEVIVATSSDVEGEATALYLLRHLAPTGVRVSRIATGVPMGGELEYVDATTLSRALRGRTPLE